MTESSKPEKMAGKEDLTGKDRIVKNVLTGWVAYMIFMVAGFIMPRLIDNYEGQVALGIWDFSWTFVNYLSMSGLGLASALNRYVPRYRTTGELEKLNQTVSTVVMLQVFIALFVLLATLAIFFSIPVYFADRLGEQTGMARWVVLLLGGSLAVEMLFDASRGVIAGYHRWDIVNGINSLSRIVSIVGMIVALLMGGGLISLAAVYFVTTCIFMVMRYLVSRRVCSDITVRISLVRFRIAKEMLRFGIKTIIVILPRIFLIQTVNIIVAASLGPAALAVFTRPVVLVKYVGTFISRFSFVLTPTAGALQASGDDQELREFILETTRVSVAITLPLLLILAVFGDVIIGLWMGEDYVNHQLIIVLAIGTFLPASQQTIVRILIGMNVHGKLGLISFAVTLLVFFLGYLYISDTGWTLVNAGALMVVSEVLGAGVVIPLFACKHLNISFFHYLNRSFSAAMFIGSIFLGVMLLNRTLLDHSPVLAMLSGITSGGLILLPLYWRFILTEPQRCKLMSYVKKSSR